MNGVLVLQYEEKNIDLQIHLGEILIEFDEFGTMTKQFSFVGVVVMMEPVLGCSR
jgi:hypothetical protein